MEIENWFIAKSCSHVKYILTSFWFLGDIIIKWSIFTSAGLLNLNTP